MFKLNQKKVGSLNEGGRKLKVGTFAYKITGAVMGAVKSNPTGREYQVIFDLLNGKDYSCKVYLTVMSPNDVAREIAEKTLVAFAQAAGIGGDLSPERLPSFIGKTVVITTRETQGKGEKKDTTYVNISTVEAPDSEADEAEEKEETEEEEETEEAEEEEETEEEEEEEEEPAPLPKKKKPAPTPTTGKPAGKKKPWE